jgi:tetratricopeptide (TPR) repeat protein
VLVLATQRPGWTAPWNEWSWPERLNLGPMGEQDTALLARAVLGGARLSPALESYVQERTGGNPLFVEELLRALQETSGLLHEEGQVRLVPGLADKVPTALTEILLARMDRLEAEVRSLAQVASVIGRSFAVRLLAQIVERNVAALQAPLSSLQRAEIAFPHHARELEYVFKHATVRDVAYQTLLKKRRQQIHAATARAIASLYPPDEQVEVIAYHLSQTADWEEAARWLERAGDRAADVYANEMAIKHYEEAKVRLEHLELQAATRAHLDEKLGAVLTTVGQYDRALTLLEQSVEFYQAVGDREGEARVLAQAGQVHYQRGTPEEGIAALRPFLESSQEGDRQAVPSPSLATAYAALALLFFATGRYDEQLSTADEAAVLAGAAADERLLARVEVSRALALLALGHREEKRPGLEHSATLLAPLAEAQTELGRDKEAEAAVAEAIARATADDDRIDLAHALRASVLLAIRQQRWDDALHTLEKAVELARHMNYP